MVAESFSCPQCQAIVPEDATTCPECGNPLEPRAELVGVPSLSADSAVATTTGATVGPPDDGQAGPMTETTRRIARLKQWSDSARPLGIELPTLPGWAEEMARSGDDSEMWSGVLRGIERLAQKKVVSALEAWEAQTRGRLVRLAAYSVEGRLEREQMEDVMHSARTSEISQALATFQQVDRVIALKERHIDQAREELERLVSLLRDMQALGIAPAHDPSGASEDLERELRSGRLAPLKQRLRTLRQEALTHLQIELPRYVAQYGTSLVRERNAGIPVELEAAELARGSREFSEGKIEEALRRLRVLSQIHGPGIPRVARESVGTASTGRAEPTEASRKA